MNLAISGLFSILLQNWHTLCEYIFDTIIMKVLFTFLLINCFSILCTFSQDNVLTDDFKFAELVQANSLSKERLFQNAKLWALSSLTPSDNLLYLDTENNSIILTGNFMLKTRSARCGIVNGTLIFKITILFKNERYKYTIDHLVHRYVVNCGEFGAYPVTAPLGDIKFKDKVKTQIYDEIDHKLRSLIADMKQSILRPKVEEDW